MKKVLFIASLMLSVGAFAQVPDSTSVKDGEDKVKKLENENIEEYRRSSLYTVLVKHSEANYGSTIDSVFMMMETPDKFNNHDLSVKSFESSSTKAKKVKADKRGTEKDPNIVDISAFIDENDIAKGMVAKWFDRDPETGYFDVELIKERGFYDASFKSIEQADATVRGRAMLADAGFDLIGKTFMIVNDITFIDHGENSAKASAGIKAGLSILGGLASIVTGDDSFQDLGNSTGELIGGIANEIAGYKVNIISYLYRLDWNEEMLDTFLSEYWIDAENPDPAKKAAFDASDLFKLSYVGYTMTSAENVSSKTFSTKPLQEQFLKVCTRALDKAIVELQREYDEFKINVPIYAVNDDGTVSVKIGLKEGVTEKSTYEVLMKDMSSGVTKYVRVGMLKPVAGKIWDNRFGAEEEALMLEEDRKAAEEAAAQGDAEAPEEAAVAEVESTAELEEGNPFLGSTTFEIVSGAGKIMPGLLIREVKIK
ncbi:MAG: hypothetical protein IAC08_06870 [Bacteroidetes bacterium]|uniref:Uncharacterized protein n=1 Tax=Candidatus Cryptobacteroides intestinigallinarum TaxID=2840767 RepID=A0A9D9N0X2_9BACT|nr:hypothetical protein [Candidatus Cryptobacteroides intestinigallinarum]